MTKDLPTKAPPPSLTEKPKTPVTKPKDPEPPTGPRSKTPPESFTGKTGSDYRPPAQIKTPPAKPSEPSQSKEPASPKTPPGDLPLPTPHTRHCQGIKIQHQLSQYDQRCQRNQHRHLQ